MNQTALRRSFNALVAMVFLLFGAADLDSMRPCPHHDRLIAAAAGEHPDHPSADEAHAEHHEHAESDPDAGEGSCACERICPGLTATPFAILSPSAVAHHDSAGKSAVLRDGDTASSRLTPYFLPYALAPPYLG